jgi:hypothetical protein
VKVEVEAGGGWWERTWMADGCEVLFGRARCCLLEEFRRDACDRGGRGIPWGDGIGWCCWVEGDVEMRGERCLLVD